MKNDITNPKGSPSDVLQPNAWLIRPGALANPFSVTLAVAPNLASGIAEGDLTALLGEQDGKSVVVLFARIFRIRSGAESTTLYFDAFASRHSATRSCVARFNGVRERH